MLNILENIWPYALAVVMFLTLILIHEFGHFIAAKILGVRVNEFSVGFGPKILSKAKGETTYMLKLIPFGGYCAMEGEDESSESERAFCNKKPWRRFIIVSMGAIFNLILGLVLTAVIVAQSSLLPTLTVAQFAENATSEQTGLAVNDTILSVNDRNIYTPTDLSYAFSGVKDGKIDMLVLRNGEKTELKGVTFSTESEEGINYINVDFWLYGTKKTVGGFILTTFKTAYSFCRIVWLSVIDLISGKYGLSAVSGPVGVTSVIGKAAKSDFASIFRIMALITINLGIFNLFPLPALDGGRLLFIIVEMIARRPVPKKFEGIVHTLGFIILLAFMVLVTFKDIYKLFAG